MIRVRQNNVIGMNNTLNLTILVFPTTTLKLTFYYSTLTYTLQENHEIETNF